MFKKFLIPLTHLGSQREGTRKTGFGTRNQRMRPIGVIPKEWRQLSHGIVVGNRSSVSPHSAPDKGPDAIHIGRRICAGHRSPRRRVFLHGLLEFLPVLMGLVKYPHVLKRQGTEPVILRIFRMGTENSLIA